MSALDHEFRDELVMLHTGVLQLVPDNMSTARACGFRRLVWFLIGVAADSPKRELRMLEDRIARKWNAGEHA